MFIINLSPLSSVLPHLTHINISATCHINMWLARSRVVRVGLWPNRVSPLATHRYLSTCLTRYIHTSDEFQPRLGYFVLIFDSIACFDTGLKVLRLCGPCRNVLLTKPRNSAHRGGFHTLRSITDAHPSLKSFKTHLHYQLHCYI